jgi:hypothetical protein
MNELQAACGLARTEVLPPGVGEYIQHLRDALLWALCQIEDDLDPDHQAALAAAHALVED